MMSKLPGIAAFSSIFLMVFSFFINTSGISFVATAATATHVVISEIQILKVKASNHDQFVELYNPTSSSVDLTGWRLTRKTKSGTQHNLVKSMSGIIPSHGFFLITPQSGFTGSVTSDEKYSGSNFITTNNTVLLYSDAGKTLVDKVGMGTASDFNGSATVNPVKSKSIERKANSGSTALSMSVGGLDEFAGNGEDTGNNSADFVLMNIPDPQNSSSSAEDPVSLTPTMSPTITDTPTPTITPSSTPIPTVTDTPTPTFVPTDTPTPTPTDTPTPTSIPTPTNATTPTNTPVPTDTSTPTPIPTVIPTSTPTETPSPTLTPTPTQVTPTPTTSPVFPTLVCTTKNIAFNILFVHISVPLFTCSFK